MGKQKSQVSPIDGIRRSLRLYHGNPQRLDRMTRFYARFVSPNSRVFDVGAHVGDRTRVFRRLGAIVVALEPQPAAFRALRLLRRGDPRVILHDVAVSSSPGEALLKVNTANPTVSSLSNDFVDAAHGADGWQGQNWDKLQRVRVTTLDALIETYGMPDFVKIDVEGHEDAVLSGLTHALPALSFEMTTIQRPVALSALARLTALGRYEFALSLGEGFVLDDGWESPDAMAQRIEALPHGANSGDVYAQRVAD